MRQTAKGKFKIGRCFLGLAAFLAVPALALADPKDGHYRGDYDDPYFDPDFNWHDYLDSEGTDRGFKCPETEDGTLSDARIIRVCSTAYEEATGHFCEDIAKDQKVTKGDHGGVQFWVITQVCFAGMFPPGYERKLTLNGTEPAWGGAHNDWDHYTTVTSWTLDQHNHGPYTEGGNVHYEESRPGSWDRGPATIIDNLVIK